MFNLVVIGMSYLANPETGDWKLNLLMGVILMRHIHIVKFSFIALLAASLLAVPALAQTTTGNGNGNGSGDGTGDCNGPLYFDSSTVATFDGTISEVVGFICQVGDGNNTGNGMHYVFTSDSGQTLYAMFGPFWYLDNNGIELEEGTAVSLTGSVVAAYNENFTEYDYIIVTKLVVGGTELVIRDDDGLPQWKGDPKGLYYNSPQYTKSQVQTMNATVVSVRTRTRGEYVDAGVELKIRTQDNQRLRVYLGPQYYCEQEGLAVKAGDQIRLRGSVQDRDMVCQYLQTGDGPKIKFRDRKGNPTWAN